MKLRNLLFGTMIACAFVACSNDDDPTPGPEVNPAELDATLTIAYQTDGAKSGLKSLSTKSIGTEVGATDATIKKIGIAVFNKGAMSPAMADGALISYREIDRTGVDTTACVSAKSGDVEVMVIANPVSADLTSLTTKAAFQAKVSGAALSSQINGNLLMTSPVYSLTLEKGRNVACSKADETDADKKFNWPDKDKTKFHNATYKVYRNVAKITLRSIKIDPREDFGKKANYATFTLDSAYVDHVRSSVYVFGNNASGWNAVVNADAEKGFLTGLVDPTYTGTNYLLNKFTEGNSATYTGNADNAVIGSTSTGELTSFYVFDNSSATTLAAGTATRLVLKGTYTYKTGNSGEDDVLESKHAYWYFDINPEGKDAGDAGYAAHFGVLRNMQYVVDATITGPGKGKDPQEPTTPPTDPDTPVTPPVNPDPNGGAACIKVKVDVVQWGTVYDHPSVD